MKYKHLVIVRFTTEQKLIRCSAISKPPHTRDRRENLI